MRLSHSITLFLLASQALLPTPYLPLFTDTLLTGLSSRSDYLSQLLRRLKQIGFFPSRSPTVRYLHSLHPAHVCETEDLLDWTGHGS